MRLADNLPMGATGFCSCRDTETLIIRVGNHAITSSLQVLNYKY